MHPRIVKDAAPVRNNMFQHMEPICFSPLCYSPKNEVSSFPEETSYFKEFALDNEGANIIREFGTHQNAGFSWEKYYASLKKCDKEPICPPDSDPFLNLALQFTEQHLFFMVDSGLSRIYDINWQTSSGHPYDMMGFPLKRDMKEGIGFDLLKTEMYNKYDPVWKVPPKVEFLPLEDIIDGKIRTFFIPPFPFLLLQKFFWQDMDKKLLANWKNCWSKYGYSKQAGGFHRLQKKIERFLLRFMSDVSGWDRVLPLLRHVYALRLKFLRPGIYEKYKDVLDWLIKNTINPLCAFKDGNIFRRFCGNGSGSNETTSDNTLAHIIVMMYVLIHLFYDCYSRMPTYSEIVDYAEVALYGDDNESSLDHEHFGIGLDDLSLKKFEDRVKELYGHFGLVIKDKAFKIDIGTRMSQLEFLGSRTYWSDRFSMYLPYPRLEKICSSLRFIGDEIDDTPEVICSKLMAIYELVSVIDDVPCTQITKSIQNFARFLLKSKFGEFSSVQQSQLVNIANPSYHVTSQVTGWEGQFQPASGLVFSTSI